MVMMLRQCCCGCTLKTGTVIIGALNILGGLTNLIIGIAAARAGDSVQGENKKVFVGIGVTLAVLGAIVLLVSIFLIIGVAKDKPALLVPWMVYSIVFTVAHLVFSIVLAAQYFSTKYAAAGVGTLVGALIYVFIETYFLLVVYSLYRELKGTAPTNTV